MNLILLKNNKTLKQIDLSNKDPLTLLSYYEILLRNPKPIFCLLICKTSKFVYLKDCVIKMRYSIKEYVNVYSLKDPISREEVKDIWFFEVKDRSEESRNVYATFISNEINVFEDDALRYKIFGLKRKDDTKIIYSFFVIVILMIWIVLRIK
jgi:hypothetical protein